MDTENEFNDTSVHDILMCVIGEALLEADASFMFGHDFSRIINKYGPLLKRKNKSVELIRADINHIKELVALINKDTPFLGNSHGLLQDYLDRLEIDVCDSPWHDL